MRIEFRLVCVAVVVATPLSAQAATLCAGYPGNTRNVCTAAVGAATLLSPTLGVLVSGGSPAVGARKGNGPFSGIGATARVNVTSVVLPDLQFDGSSTTVAAGEKITALSPMFEATFGVYHGNARGMFAVDLLGSAQLMPTGAVKDVHLDRNALRIGNTSVGIGIGTRVTLLPEATAVPEVTVSLMRRGVPRLGVGSTTAGDQYAFVLGLHAMNYRAMLVKRFGSFSLGAGVGLDQYRGEANVAFQQPLAVDPQSPPAFKLKDDRMLGFVNAGMLIGRFHLVGEIGVQRGADLRAGVTFTDNNPQDQRRFGSLGLRLGF